MRFGEQLVHAVLFVFVSSAQSGSDALVLEGGTESSLKTLE
jgi:hypothetical protein